MSIKALAINTPISFDSKTHEIMEILGVSTLEQFINFMNDAHDACIHSCDYLDNRKSRKNIREHEIFGDISQVRDDWKSAWLDYSEEYSCNFC